MRLPPSVIAAIVSAQLSHARIQARQLSLVAKNASAIAARAGERCAGFRAVTQYIDQLAVTMGEHATEIHRLAVSIAREAVNIAHSEDALQRFESVVSQQQQLTYFASLIPQFQRTQRQHEQRRLLMRQQIQQLRTLLDEANLSTRAAASIASLSRVEASHAGDYQQQLQVIADSIERVTNVIKSHLAQATSLMYEL